MKVAAALILAASSVYGHTPDTCEDACRQEGHDGCCYFRSSTSTCTWFSGGHVQGGASGPTDGSSANCYHAGSCDGWNSAQSCSGTGEVVPEPGPSPSPTPPPSPSPSPPLVLAWSDEFDACPNGRPDPKKWGYEHGLVRNNEAQWYQSDNAACVNGSLVITARREHPAEHPSAEYTSASLTGKGLQEFSYGRFEMRGKIDIRAGSWPAWWTLGVHGSWPQGGEIDIMEYYRGNVLANFFYGDKWNSKRTPVDDAWASEFHTWVMDWDEETITISVDGEVRNTEAVSKADCWAGKPVYMIINQALGGSNGGDPSATTFPMYYEVDYVRVYQRATEVVV